MASHSVAPTVAAGVATAVTGFAGSFAVVIAGLKAVGASDAEVTSGLIALSVLQGALAIGLSVRFRQPISIAWSTPGAAMLVAAPHLPGGFPAAVGAFIVTGVLIVITGLWPAIARLVMSIPAPIAQGLLAGILVPICLVPVQASFAEPLIAVPVVIVWLVFVRLLPRWATPAAILVALVIALVDGGGAAVRPAELVPAIGFIPPAWDWAAIVSVALPLYLVTMAGQNIPGLAVLGGHGYARPPVRSILVVSGAGSVVAALFGGHSLSLSALSATMVVSKESHPDPAKRWIASTTTGVAYVVLGLVAAVVTAIAAAAPPLLIEGAAGLAMISALAGAVVGGFKLEHGRIAAAVTLLVAASGLSAFGIGSAFWALVAGGAVWLVTVTLRPRRAERIE